ncbi:MAG: hypothetical protein ABW189_01365 [Rickettsiales bacterium]
MTVARLLAEADSRELAEYAAYYRIKQARAEEEELARGAWDVVDNARARRK